MHLILFSNMSHPYLRTVCDPSLRTQGSNLEQLCLIRGPVEGFVRPSLGVRRTDNLSLFW